MPDDRREYVLSLRRKVLSIARSLVRRLPQGSRETHFDDFIQAGWIGAIHAVDGHDAKKGTLEAYANWRIRGEILDYMRDCDFLKRDHRRSARKAGIEIKGPLSIDQMNEDGISLSVEDRQALRPFGSVDASHDLLAALRRGNLKPRDQKLLLDYYWELGTLKELGKTLHIGESRVSQICNGAMRALQSANAEKSQPVPEP